ncbi:unannotated protein [freshwater metagenome]|uniref:Unannotated protein n=1 Tax=freshwater metagenome TaxID=449393 RepID=A0A6J7F2X8_9ZZZZ
MTRSRESLTGGHHLTGRLHHPAKVSRIQSSLQHGLVDPAKPSKGKGRFKKSVREPAVLQFVAQSPQGIFNNQRVVKGQRGKTVGRKPLHVFIIERGGRLVTAHERPVHD